MFFDSSMRSTRTMRWRSPTRSSSSRSFVAHASDAATLPMSSASAAAGATNVVGVTPPPSCAQHASNDAAQRPQQRRRDVVGQHAHGVGRGERRVVEVHDAQVVAQLTQRAGDEGEVVVLHEDGRTGGRLVGDRPGVGVVHPPERLPRRSPRAIEPGPARHVVEAVVEEPQRAVGDHVVVAGEVLDHDRQHAVAVALDHAPLGGPLVGLAQRGGDPRRLGALERTADDGDEPAAASLHLQVAVVADRERDRSAVRRQHDGGHVVTVPTTVATA
jgi:hypothetical protein